VFFVASSARTYEVGVLVAVVAMVATVVVVVVQFLTECPAR